MEKLSGQANINFASDNWAAAHPNVLKALNNAGLESAPAYGQDAFTKRAKEGLCDIFGDADIFFTFNGTGANYVSLASLVDRFDCVITPALSHIFEDEAGAVGAFTGATIAAAGGRPAKLTVKDIEPFLSNKGNVHKLQPKAVSISNATEMGEVYSDRELKELRGFCDLHGLYLYLDGSRLANAAATLEVRISALAAYADIASFGGTKNGGMGAEALIVYNKSLSKRLSHFIKQGGQLASKTRYLAAQFMGLLEGDIWLKNAQNANAMTALLLRGLRRSRAVKITGDPKVNMVFCEIDNALIKKLETRFAFHVMKRGEISSVVRLMTSWQTAAYEVGAFLEIVDEYEAET